MLQSLIEYYQKNTLEKIFPEVKTPLQIPYKDASWCYEFTFCYFYIADNSVVIPVASRTITLWYITDAFVKSVQHCITTSI